MKPVYSGAAFLLATAVAVTSWLAFGQNEDRTPADESQALIRPALEEWQQSPQLPALDDDLTGEIDRSVASDVAAVEAARKSLHADGIVPAAWMQEEVGEYQALAAHAREQVSAVEPLLERVQSAVQDGRIADLTSVVREPGVAERLESVSEAVQEAEEAREAIVSAANEIADDHEAAANLVTELESSESENGEDEKSVWEKIFDVLIFVLRIILFIISLFGGGEDGAATGGGSGMESAALAGSLATQAAGFAHAAGDEGNADDGTADVVEGMGDFVVDFDGEGDALTLELAAEDGRHHIVPFHFGTADDEFIALAIEDGTISVTVLEENPLVVRIGGLSDGIVRRASFEDDRPLIRGN